MLCTIFSNHTATKETKKPHSNFRTQREKPEHKLFFFIFFCLFLLLFFVSDFMLEQIKKKLCRNLCKI